MLRRSLLADPALVALLKVIPCHVALGGVEDFPFRIDATGLVLLSPVCLENIHVLAVAARWALEACFQRERITDVGTSVLALLRYGMGLLESVPVHSQKAFLGLLPQPLRRDLWDERAAPWSPGVLAWIADRMGVVIPAHAESLAKADLHELTWPVEKILVAGGDGRLALDPDTCLNRYGVPPRPRPEAVHFSSSTASAISEHGLMFCELLRRDLVCWSDRDDIALTRLRTQSVRALGLELLTLLQLHPEEADVAISPSGTDAELLTVAIARQGGECGPLVNIIVSPEESGSGVKLAGSGCFFDEWSALGTPVCKGEPLWPEGPIPLVDVPIRDHSGQPRSLEVIDAEFLQQGRQALEQGCRVLAHVLITSKTGLSAPSLVAVDALVALDPQRVDVVVDACQTRTSFEELGNLVRKGWMIQVTGSKFLTGPPFSGALIVPAALRQRAGRVGETLVEHPEVGHPLDWSCGWSECLPESSAPSAGFGPIFRWLPALLEAELLIHLTEEFRHAAFVRFREAILRAVADNRYILPIQMGEGAVTDDADSFARLSILSFQVLGSRADGCLEPLSERSCRKLFEYLNRDMSAWLPGLGLADQTLARTQAHLGQPVTLSGTQAITALRLVLGARFFNAIGYLHGLAREAMLQSEIADARRAMAKVGLLAANWWRLESEEKRYE
ncbi:MAG: hypothetical protein HQL92_06500 [Magnetococcales bacterium]|nr:hypothetical protein [Magnetococcales bacterium]